MSSAPPPNRPIEFRNATLGTTVAVLRLSEPHLLADALHKMLGGMPDFFSGDATILDFAQLAGTPERIDWPGLMSLLRRFRLQPIGVRNLDAALATGARQVGLALLDDIELRERQAAPAPAPSPEPPPTAPVSAAAPPPPRSADPARTVFVDRPLRSGQQVYARGGDIVLLAGMSNGAEVIADGSIHCYGPLRGRALAGAQGNTEARIITTNFGPEIVSIAGVYKTFEQGVPESIAARPTHVRMVGGAQDHTLAIEPLRLD